MTIHLNYLFNNFMSNEAVAGFIAIKTLQNKPLRYFDANFNEFRDKNMTMYIQKKYADLKSFIKSNILFRTNRCIRTSNTNIYKHTIIDQTKGK